MGTIAAPKSSPVACVMPAWKSSTPALRQTPDMIAEAALQEDVDIVGVSILSGSHMTLVPAVRAALNVADLTDLPLVVGGIVPDDDQRTLLAQSNRRHFRAGHQSGPDQQSYPVAGRGDGTGIILMLTEIRRGNRRAPGALADSGGERPRLSHRRLVPALCMCP